MPVCSLVGAGVSTGQKLRGVSRAPNVLQEVGLCSAIKALGYNLNEHLCSLDPDEFSPPTTAASTPSGSTEEPKRPIMDSVYDESRLKDVGYACEAVHWTVYDAANHFENPQDIVVTIGGDHSIASATIGAMLKKYGERLRVLWIDAHADINIPEDSPSGSYHGMPVAHLMGLFNKKAPGFDWLDSAPLLKPQNIAYIGLRDLDSAEVQTIKKYGITAFRTRDIVHYGLSEVLNRCIRSLRLDEPDAVLHVSFDIDACDPAIAPGTGTRARGGLTYRETMYLCEEIASRKKLVSFDLVEVNPEIDESDLIMHGDDIMIAPEATKTVRLAAAIITAALATDLL